jgi:hypothetical protein
MSDIALELTIKATPEDVFYAITWQDGITHWWANRVHAEPTVGSITEIYFDKGRAILCPLGTRPVHSAMSPVGRCAQAAVVVA